MRVVDALERFPPVRGHLDAATSGVPPVAAAEAARAAVDAWAAGRVDGPVYDAAVERSRAAFARIVGGIDPADVACGGQASGFTGLVAAALAPGATVLVADGDFTSVLFPVLVAEQRRGVAVRSVPLDRLVEAIDGDTALVAVSATQSADGATLDLEALARAADHHGADVYLDATQAAGWLPIDARRFAYVVAGAYKWLLSPRGTTFCAIRPDAAERVAPLTAGWYAAQEPWGAVYGGPLRLADTAKRFDLSPAWIAWAGTAPAVELIAELGPEEVGAYDLALARRLREGLGLPEPERPSPIVATEVPDAQRRLQAAGIKAVSRAGRVRLACHLPATEQDVDRAVEALTCGP